MVYPLRNLFRWLLQFWKDCNNRECFLPWSRKNGKGKPRKRDLRKLHHISSRWQEPRKLGLKRLVRTDYFIGTLWKYNFISIINP